MTETVHDTLSINISAPAVSVVAGKQGAVSLSAPQTAAAGAPDRATVAMHLSKIEEIIEYLKALYR